MYYLIVVFLMLVFPALSIAIDAGINHVHLDLFLLGKWYVFWAVGMRLSLAGLRQIVQPRYTSEKILGIRGDDALLVVRELGFANFSIGVLGLASIFVDGWTLAGALVGGIFYGLAGINHLLHGNRNRLQNVAMVSDLFAAIVLLCCCQTVLL
jgi:hypothetical protein